MNRCRTKKLGHAWLAFTLALALHVFDEATHEFLSVYNRNVLGIRARFSFVPLPTFTFREWIAGLSLGILLLLLLTATARRGPGWIHFLAVMLGLLVGIANGMGHIVYSIYTRSLMPGVLSAPVIIVTGAWLIREALARDDDERLIDRLPGSLQGSSLMSASMDDHETDNNHEKARHAAGLH